MVLDVIVFMLSLNCSVDFQPNFWHGFDNAITQEWNINVTTSCLQVDKFPSTFAEYKELAKAEINNNYNNNIPIRATGSTPTEYVGTDAVAISTTKAMTTNQRDIIIASANTNSNTDHDYGNSNNNSKHHQFKSFSEYFDNLLLQSRISTSSSSSSTTLPGEEDNNNSIRESSENKNLPASSSSPIRHQQAVFLTQYSQNIFQRGDAEGIAYPGQDIGFVKNNYYYSTSVLNHEILHLVLEEEGYPMSCYVDKVHENQFNFVLKEMGPNGEKYPLIKKFDC